MLKKIFLTNSMLLKPATVNSTGALTNPGEVVQITPPENMFAQRCTVNLIDDGGGGFAEICISSQMPVTNIDGIRLTTNIEVTSGFTLPSYFTFEDYQNTFFSTNLFIANMAARTGSDAAVVIVWEGIEK